MGIFKAYDIRGVYGLELDTRLAYKLGRALPRFLKKNTFLIGHDAREHSNELYRALIRGLVDEGKKVTGIGLASTPQLHFYQIREGFEGAVMVTASHNPPEYHGFKIYDGRGGSISYTKGLDKLERLLPALKDEPPVGGGSFSEADKIDEYIDFVAGPLAALKGERLPFKVLIDPGNGSSGRVFRRLSEKLGLDSIIINERPDGRFPGRGPNPLKEESKKTAAARVREVGADFGGLLDGDGDRILFLDELGEGIENYYLACLIAEEILPGEPGAAIVYDLISSRTLPERIRELGGKPVVSRVGYTFIYDKMVANRAIFGSETSGHVYFKVTDEFYTESAAYALVILLRLLQKRGKKLSELTAPLKTRYFQPPEINIEVDNNDLVLKKVESHFSEAKIGKLDGISVEFPDYWFNVRPSNTEPLIRLRLEAKNRDVAEARAREIKALLESWNKS